MSGFGVNPSWTGYTQTVYAIGLFLWGLFFGKLSDTYGRKKMLGYTSLLNLLSYIIMIYSIWNLDFQNTEKIPIHWESIPVSFSFGWDILQWFSLLFGVFLVARMIGGLWGAGFGVIQAYISDISSPENRTKNMGYMGAAFGLAFLIGPALWAVLSHFFGIHVTLLVSIWVIFINVMCILFFVKEPIHHNTKNIPTGKFHFSRSVIMLLVLSFWMILGFSWLQSMSSQFYADRFDFDATKIGATMAVVWLVAVMYQWLIIRFVREKFVELQMIRWALFILIIGFIGFGLNMSPIWLFAWLPLFPLGMWTFQPSVWSLLSQRAGKEVWRVMGYNTSIQSIGQIFGPLLAGLTYTPGSGTPFFLSAGIFFLLLCLAMQDIIQ
jgi:MFS family permease